MSQSDKATTCIKIYHGQKLPQISKLLSTLQAELDFDRSALLKVPAAQGIAEEVPPGQLKQNIITFVTNCAYLQK